MNENDNAFSRLIPKIETLEMWEKFEFIHSPFVEIPNIIKKGTETKIIVDMQYPKLRYAKCNQQMLS